MNGSADLILKLARHAYFIGIGGVGMSALARVMKFLGWKVSGSDVKANAITHALVQEGIPVHLGQNALHFEDADLAVYSTAIDASHLELKAARESKMPVLHRAQVLATLFNQAKTSVAVTGTHGKTTTSSMIAYVLSRCGKKPMCLVGGDLLNFGTNALFGDANLWVSEVDESDKSHELYSPSYTVLTNLEDDHPEHYRDLKEVEQSFERFLARPCNPGVVIYSKEDPILGRLLNQIDRPKIRFGFAPDADFSAQNVQLNGMGSEFDFFETAFFSTRVHLSVPGLHNVLNAAAAMTLLIQLGLDPDEIASALTTFQGARRRLEKKWQSGDLLVIDDYAHHPTEVQASIRALRQLGHRLTVIFQPHRFSRTRRFFKEFGTVFDDVDDLILTDVYGAGEPNPDKVDIQWIYRQLMDRKHPSVKVVAKEAITSELLSRHRLTGTVAFLGAGDIGDIANEFTNQLKNFATA